MLIVAALIAISIGIGIIYISLKDYRALAHDIELLKTLSNKKDRVKVSATVISLGVNTDFPTVLLAWPQDEDFEDKESYRQALGKAYESYDDAMAKIETFGNYKIEYKYVAPDGDTYISRTVSRIPESEHLDVVYKLKIGKKISAYLDADNYSDSILKVTSPEAFEKYHKQVQKPQRARIAVGCLLIGLGAAAPWMPWSFSMAS